MTIRESNSVVPGNLERIIAEKGLRPDYVARKAGFSKQQLCDMRNGRRIIRARDVVALAGALGVNAGALFGENEKCQPGGVTWLAWGDGYLGRRLESTEPASCFAEG